MQWPYRSPRIWPQRPHSLNWSPDPQKCVDINCTAFSWTPFSLLIPISSLGKVNEHRYWWNYPIHSSFSQASYDWCSTNFHNLMSALSLQEAIPSENHICHEEEPWQSTISVCEACGLQISRRELTIFSIWNVLTEIS